VNLRHPVVRDFREVPRPDGELLWVEGLDPDEVDELREGQRRQDAAGPVIVCPECGNGWPEFHLVHSVTAEQVATGQQPIRRPHFRHMAGGRTHRHGRQRWMHELGKQVLAAWVCQRYPAAQVISKGVRDGRVDVVVQLAGGRPLSIALDGYRYAVEVQYSPLSPAEWQDRHQRYQAAGVTDVWLFGFGEADPDPARPTLAPVHEAVLRAGQPLRWLLPRGSAGHPNSALIRTGWCPRRRLGHRGAWAETWDDRLGVCRLRDGVFIVPRGDHFRARAQTEEANRQAAAAAELRRLLAQPDHEEPAHPQRPQHAPSPTTPSPAPSPAPPADLTAEVGEPWTSLRCRAGLHDWCPGSREVERAGVVYVQLCDCHRHCHPGSGRNRMWRV
jgi:hypothetical protein